MCPFCQRQFLFSSLWNAVFFVRLIRKFRLKVNKWIHPPPHLSQPNKVNFIWIYQTRYHQHYHIPYPVRNGILYCRIPHIICTITCVRPCVLKKIAWFDYILNTTQFHSQRDHPAHSAAIFQSMFVIFSIFAWPQREQLAVNLILCISMKLFYDYFTWHCNWCSL